MRLWLKGDKNETIITEDRMGEVIWGKESILEKSSIHFIGNKIAPLHCLYYEGLNLIREKVTYNL